MKSLLYDNLGRRQWKCILGDESTEKQCEIYEKIGNNKTKQK